MRRALCVQAVFCGMLFFAACMAWLPLLAAAVPSAASLQSATVILAGDRDYAPYQFVDDAGHASGFDVELFRAIANQAELEVDVQLGDWDANIEHLQSGAVDVVPMFVSPERARKYLFSTPFLRRYHLVFGQRGQEYVASLDQLAGKRVAVQHSGLAWERLVSMGNVAIVPTQAEYAALDLVRSGRADYALVPMNIGYAQIMRHQDGDIVALSPPLLEYPYAFAVTPSRPQLVERINAALRSVQASGVRDRLYLEWLANLRPAQVSYRHGFLTGAAIALPLLLLSVATLLWLRRWRKHATSEAQRAEAEMARRRELEDRIEFLAFHDTETALPNLNGLMRVLHQCVRERIHDAGHFAVIRLDLANLDMLRTVGGDDMERQVRKTVGSRLVRAAAEACVARVARGEFAIAVPAIDSIDAAQALMHKFMLAAQKRMTINELPLEQHCCAGMAVYPEHGGNAEDLLRAASMACNSARKQRSKSMVYDRSLEPDPRNLTLLTELHEVIAAESLGYAMQPKLNLHSMRIVGAEMLVRWQHERHGALAPSEFVPLAEKAGVIGFMTEYMVKRAIHHGSEWRGQGHDLSLSVNVAVNDLADHDLVSSLIGMTRAADCKLMLEITESELMHDDEEVLASIRQLRSSGASISLDDFGTGYSSLTYLKRMAPDELKIDRSFIRDVLHAPSDQTIVRASIELAHSFGAAVTAEGIEDESTLEWLATAGCDAAQGNIIAKPMPAEDLLPWLCGRARSSTQVAFR